MAKKELFTNRIFGWWIRMCGAFPIDRENPGAEAIKYPVNMLKKSNRSLIMFPSGSRHSQDVKGGVAIIAKMAKVRIMPVTYTGPRDLKGLATGERIDMNFGHPIDISDIKKMNDPTKPFILIRLLKILLIPLVLVVGILTLLFSYLASFVWDPDKHRKNK